jgi:predicted DNA-binding transcriptional regulator AlpA
MEALLDTEEAAKVLGIAPGSLRQWRKRGIGPRHVKVGRFVRYRPAEIERWLESRTRTSTRERPLASR